MIWHRAILQWEQLVEIYGVDQLDVNTFPPTYQTINKNQRKAKELVEQLKCANYHTKYFREGRNMFMLICNNYKNFVPTILQKCVVNWYHTYILHPGKVRTEATISQHYYWLQLRDDILTHIKVCNTCHKKQKQNLRYGKLTAKEVEAIAWDILSLYLIGPYKIIREGRNDPLILNALTMIDLSTGWF